MNVKLTLNVLLQSFKLVRRQLVPFERRLGRVGQCSGRGHSGLVTGTEGTLLALLTSFLLVVLPAVTRKSIENGVE